MAGMSRSKIRDLTELEKKCSAKYRERMIKASLEMAAAREVLNDMAIVFSGREGPVEMTPDALYEPEESSGS